MPAEKYVSRHVLKAGNDAEMTADGWQ